MASRKQQDDVRVHHRHQGGAPNHRQPQREDGDDIFCNRIMDAVKPQQPPRFRRCAPPPSQQPLFQPCVPNQQPRLRLRAPNQQQQIQPQLLPKDLGLCYSDLQQQREVPKPSLAPGTTLGTISKCSPHASRIPRPTRPRYCTGSASAAGATGIAGHLQLERSDPLYEQMQELRQHDDDDDDKDFSPEVKDAERPKRPTSLFGSEVTIQPHGKGVELRMPRFSGKSTKTAKIVDDPERRMTCKTRTGRSTTRVPEPAPSKPATTSVPEPAPSKPATTSVPEPAPWKLADKAEEEEPPVQDALNEEEDWEKLPPCPSFNPLAHIMNQPFLWIPPGLTKSERRAYREQEMRRRDELEQLELELALLQIEGKTPSDKEE